MPEDDTQPPTPTPAPLSTDLKTNVIPINPVTGKPSALGDLCLKGGPGRPKGLKNKFTKIKEEMLDVWTEEGGKEKFREMFRGEKFERGLDKIIQIMPKEIEVDASLDEGTQSFFYKMAQKAGLVPQDNPQQEANENPPA